MNRFYVVEGNKRVSVLKYFDAVSIAAHVTRIVPRRTDTLESKIYFEFLDFYRITGINYVWFTKEGNFLEAAGYPAKDKKSDWDQEFSRDFRSAYYRFRKAYAARGGRKLSISTGDAMLEYLKVFGYEGLLEKSHAQLMDDVAKMWDEICLQTEEKPVGLVTHPIEEPNKKGLFNFLSGSSKKTKLKVGFVHDKTGNHQAGPTDTSSAVCMWMRCLRIRWRPTAWIIFSAIPKVRTKCWKRWRTVVLMLFLQQPRNWWSPA
ncbi:MAG: hypothetical protein ACLR23_00675 [Clostridia bacterium]